MFHKIKAVQPLRPHILRIQFSEGVTKDYNIRALAEENSVFHRLIEDPVLLAQAAVDVGGYGVVFDDDLDLSCDALWDGGTTVSTPFDGLLAFSEATELWGLNESTLRKAIAYGKLNDGADAQKFGKQWVISRQSMLREYGEPANPKSK